MSSCGKCGARVSGGKGAAGAAAVSVKTVSVFRLSAIKQFGHSPAGAFSESGAPHCGHRCEEALLITISYRTAEGCYRTQLVPDRASSVLRTPAEYNSAIQQI